MLEEWEVWLVPDLRKPACTCRMDLRAQGRDEQHYERGVGVKTVHHALMYVYACVRMRACVRACVPIQKQEYPLPNAVRTASTGAEWARPPIVTIFKNPASTNVISGPGSL